MLKWEENNGTLQCKVKYLDKEKVIRIVHKQPYGIHEILFLEMLSENGWVEVMSKRLPYIPELIEIIQGTEFLKGYANSVFGGEDQ